MTDRTTETLKRAMQAIVDVAPEAPEVPVERLAPRRRLSPLAVAAAAFALVLLVGGATALLTGPERGVTGPETEPAPSVTTLPPTTWPPTTMATSEVVYDTAAAVAWAEWVTEALASAAWDDPVIATYETHLPFLDGGTVTALVGETDWSRLIVDLQGWAPGEFRDDPTWQRDVAGSAEPGLVTPEGTLFTRADHTNVVVLVNDNGLLTLQLNRDEDETARLEAIAAALAPAMAALTTND